MALFGSAILDMILFCIFMNSLLPAFSEEYLDGTKSLKRHSGNGLAFANFAVHKFRHLNITPLVTASVKNIKDCGRLCVDHSSCFSVNFAAFFHEEGLLLCELLPSDKYNNSDKFLDSVVFHHLSIKTPCSSDPCMNSGTCVAKYEDDEYHCACAEGFLGKYCEEKVRFDCQDLKKQGNFFEDGMYWLDPDRGSHSNAFLAYCDMTSYSGGWTMCYTTDEFTKPKTEVTYNPELPYGTDGYRTNCNQIKFSEIIFIDHQTGNKSYFTNAGVTKIKADGNYGNRADTYGLWHGFGSMNDDYEYQLLICDNEFYSGFLVSGYRKIVVSERGCYKECSDWCGDFTSPYFRTAANGSDGNGVAFNTNGHRSLANRLISVGLR
ncbi:unnamed protein product [Porites evermanni]|uniref:EGF-like domain-containing protein n=1 Tax=Porites evermanni TaxID=104178 RepID=A0ABN8PGF6_9CNID|nr:unnamed protein product [Porites evermanni]